MTNAPTASPRWPTPSSALRARARGFFRPCPGSNDFALVGGWPGSGKSTLARALALETRLPLLAKDEIKEALADGLGRPETVTDSQ